MKRRTTRLDLPRQLLLIVWTLLLTYSEYHLIISERQVNDSGNLKPSLWNVRTVLAWSPSLSSTTATTVNVRRTSSSSLFLAPIPSSFPSLGRQPFLRNRCHAGQGRRLRRILPATVPTTRSPQQNRNSALTTITTTTTTTTTSLNANKKNDNAVTTRISKSASSDSRSDDTATTTLFENPEQFIPIAILSILGTIVVGTCIHFGYTIEDVIAIIQQFVSHPQETIGTFIELVKDMGPMGTVYFGVFYLIAETLAIPATPLALSAGYLFGLTTGFSVVLAAATMAACIGFYVGKTYLRSYVETILEQNPKFAKIDRAVGQKGFKLLVLVRLSPIFPFSISNYIYGASSIDFVSYFWGTVLGFTPSTLAYVYTGMVGKEVMFGGADGGQLPWYAYVGGLTVLVTLLKLVTDVATGIIDAIDDDDTIIDSQ